MNVQDSEHILANVVIVRRICARGFTHMRSMHICEKTVVSDAHRDAQTARYV